MSLSFENARRAEESALHVDTDALTHLPNGKAFFLRLDAELQRCRRTSGSLGIVICDLNSFRQVNDREGHMAGDRLLALIAERFVGGCRPYDTVARIGGDEFVFLLPDINSEDCSERLQSISDMVDAACGTLQFSTKVSASLGSCCFPADGQTAEELMALADRRMYRHKKAYYKSLSQVDPRLVDSAAV